MKKYLYFSIAALALVSCSDDEYIGQGAGTGQKENLGNAIMIGGNTAAFTRAEDHVAGDAATLLDNNFVVEGIKGDGSFGDYAAKNVVFDHYNVNYKAGTANTTESNTKDWEYVDQDQVIKGLSAKLSSATAQTIKFWDYSQNQYDFVAVSLGKGVTTTPAEGDPTTSYAKLSAIDYKKIGGEIKSNGSDAVYTLTGTTDELAASYVADLITLYNHDGVKDYGTIVTPKFRRLGAKVRIAFYETVPGYSVGDVEFYAQKWVDAKPGTTTNGTSSATPTLFSETAVFSPATGDGKMSVYYPTVGFAKRPGGTAPDADYNQAHVVLSAGDMTMAKTKTFGALNYTNPTTSAKNTGKALGVTSATATYAGDPSVDNAYYTVLPLGSSDNLQIRIKYTLYPDDGGAETIVVDNACAVVPKAYCEWNPNYAYTYIFKISDNTNGATGVDGDGNIVEGLTPITFDAVVIDTEDGIQETITTVATPSITTYQLGKVVTSYDEYEAGDIYASVMNGTTEVDLSSLTAPAGVAVYTATTTNTIEGITEETVTSKLMGHNNGITLTSCGYTIVSEVPAADGNTLEVSAAKFSVASSKTYVFMYTDGSKNYVKVIKVQ